jgi:hypothetical protein
MTLRTILGLGCLLASGAAAAGIRVSAKVPRSTVNCESPGRLEVTGSVIEAGAESFALDLCLPTQDCNAPIRAEFSAAAPGFAGFQRLLKPASFIQVSMVVETRDGGCAQQMTVASIASWVGDRNPAGGGDELRFAAAEDAIGPPGRAWYEATRCANGDNTISLTLRGTHITLRTGAARDFTVGNASWSARLIGAGVCGSPRGWSYWVAGPPAP